MRELGATHVINSNENGFEQKLRDLAHGLKASCLFDGVGGKLAGTIFKCMPDHSVWYSYGIFSLEKLSGINPQEFIFRGK